VKVCLLKLCYHTLLYFVYAVYCLEYKLVFDISVLLSWRWKDTCTNIPHRDLEGRDPAAWAVGGDWGVRACGLTPSAVSPLGIWTLWAQGSGTQTKNFEVLLKFYHKETSFMGVTFSLQYTQE
jgi:hypothetical protein